MTNKEKPEPELSEERTKKKYSFKSKAILVITVIVIFLVASFAFVIPNIIEGKIPFIENTITKNINGSAEFEKIEVGIFLDVKIKDAKVYDTKKKLICDASEVKIGIAPLKFLSNFNIVESISNITVKDGNLNLSFDKECVVNVGDLLKPTKDEPTKFSANVELENIKANVEGPYGSFIALVDGDVDCAIASVYDLDLQGTVNGKEVEVDGLIKYGADKKLSFEDIDVKTKQFPLEVIKAFKPDFDFTGKIDSNFTFNGSIMDPKIEGIFKAKSIRTQGEVFQDVKIPISAENDKLNVVKGSAVFAGGKINFDSNYSFKTSKVEGVLNLNNNNMADILKMPDEKISTTGKAAFKGVLGKDYKVNLYLNLNKLVFREAVFNKVDAEAIFEPKKVTVAKAAAYYAEKPGSSLQGLVRLNGVAVDGKYKLDAQIEDIPIEKFQVGKEKKATGRTSAKVYFRGSVYDPIVKLNFTINDGVILKQNFIETKGDIKIDKKIIQIIDAHVLMKPVLDLDSGTHDIVGTIDLNSEDPILNIEVTTVGVRLESLLEAIAPDLGVTGNLTNVLVITGPMSNPKVKGKLDYKEGRIKNVLVDKIKGNYEFKEGKLDLKEFLIDALQTKVSLDGSMYPDKSLAFNIKANNINLGDIDHLDYLGKVKGSAKFTGKIKGTLDDPFFDGILDIPKLEINGETITDFNSMLESHKGIVNIFSGIFSQGKTGMFDVELKLDLNENFIQAKLATRDANLASLLKMAKYNKLDIEGNLNGTIKINENGKGTGLEFDTNLTNAKVKNVKYTKVALVGNLKKDILTIDTLVADEENGGKLGAKGYVNFDTKQLEGEIAGSQMTANALTVALKKDFNVDGLMDFVVQLKGTTDKPIANTSFHVYKGGYNGFRFDTLVGMGQFKNHTYSLDQLIVSKGEYSISAYGLVPQDLFVARKNRVNPKAQMEIKVDFENTDLAILPMFTTRLESASGPITGQLKIAGTLEDPLIYGAVEIKNGIIKAKKIDSLFKNINVDIVCNADKVLLNQLNVTLGDGFIKGSGIYDLSKENLNPYYIQLIADNAYLKSVYYTGALNGWLDFSPIPEASSDDNFISAFKEQDKLKLDRVSGQEVEHDSFLIDKKAPERIIEMNVGKPLLKGELKFDDVVFDVPSITEDKNALYPEILLNIGLEIGNNVKLYNKYLYDIGVEGSLGIKGSTNNPFVTGSIKAKKGTITYLRTDFDITKAVVSFMDKSSVIPQVNLVATTRFGRYKVNATIKGLATNLDLNLSSSPILDKNTLFRMLALQDYTGSTLKNSVGSDQVEGLVNAGLELALLGNVEDQFKRELNLEKFSIYSGPLKMGGFLDNIESNDYVADGGDKEYNYFLSKRVLKSWVLGYTTSFDNEVNYKIVEYELTPRANLVYLIDQDSKRTYGAEYTISF